jgi:hypothetical protein
MNRVIWLSFLERLQITKHSIEVYWVTFQVLTAASLRMTAFLDITWCSLVEAEQCFRLSTASIIKAIFFLRDYMVPYPQKLSSSCSVLWVPEISFSPAVRIWCIVYSVSSVQFCHLYVVLVTVCTYWIMCGGGRVHDVMITGIAQPYSWDEGSSSSDRDKKESGTSSHPTSVTHSPTPPPQRRLAKSFSVAPSAVTKGNYGFHLLASLQLCPSSVFLTSLGHLCCIFKLCSCLIPNCTSFTLLYLY